MKFNGKLKNLILPRRGPGDRNGVSKRFCKVARGSGSGDLPLPSPSRKVSAKLYSRLVKVGKVEDVDLVISNLPSGIAFGQKLAHKVGAAHVILPNFPGSQHLSDNYRKMMERKAQQVFQSIEFAQAGRKPSND